MNRVVLCAANAYEKKFYMNPDFKSLPEEIKKELKVMSCLFTEDIGGIFSLYFEKDGALKIEVKADEGDLLYDEIGSELKIREIQRTKAELFRSVELYYKLLVK